MCLGAACSEKGYGELGPSFLSAHIMPKMKATQSVCQLLDRNGQLVQVQVAHIYICDIIPQQEGKTGKLLGTFFACSLSLPNAQICKRTAQLAQEGHTSSTM
jgi:hypothetical protein